MFRVHVKVTAPDPTSCYRCYHEHVSYLLKFWRRSHSKDIDDSFNFIEQGFSRKKSRKTKPLNWPFPLWFTVNPDYSRCSFTWCFDPGTLIAFTSMPKQDRKRGGLSRGWLIAIKRCSQRQIFFLSNHQKRSLGELIVYLTPTWLVWSNYCLSISKLILAYLLLEK